MSFLIPLYLCVSSALQVDGWQAALDKLSTLHGSPAERLEGSAQVLLQELLPQGLVR